MEEIDVGYHNLFVNKDIINDFNFTIEHNKRSYLVYVDKNVFLLKFSRKHNAEYFLYKVGIKSFHYISSNGDEYDKELHLFPDEEYEWKQFKYLKRKDKK